MQVLNSYKMHKFTSNLICSRLQKLNDLRMISLTSQIEGSLIFLTQAHKNTSKPHCVYILY